MKKVESLAEYEKKKNFERKFGKPLKILTIILIIVVSIILGIVTYKICDNILNPKDEIGDEPFLGQELDLNDENTKILYQYVTYGVTGSRNRKFVEDYNVDISSFTNQEKHFYAFQFVQPEDFEFTGEYDSAKHKIYVLPMSKLKYYMEVYFGPDVTFTPEPSISHPFTFQINRMNVGTMTYNASRDGYDTIFASYQDLDDGNAIDPVYGQLISALVTAEGTVILQERVVYTELRTDNGNFAVDIYKDPDKKILLETKSDLTEVDLRTLTIDVSSYPSTAIVEYTFGLNNQICYFLKSRIMI